MRAVTRILAIADETTDSLSVQRIKSIAPDLVVACGDLPFDYLDYVASAANRTLLFVPGNHDPDLKSRPLPMYTDSDFTLAWKEPPGPPGGVNLDGNVEKWTGLTFAGLGGSIRSGPGPNQYSEREMWLRTLRLRARARAREMVGKGRVDVLVTHAPPRGHGDLEDLAHRGFECFEGLVERLQPEVVLHGQVHPRGFEKPDRTIGTSRLVNVIPYEVIEVDR
jgi:Icc-related predicted phosphoesterase